MTQYSNDNKKVNSFQNKSEKKSIQGADIKFLEPDEEAENTPFPSPEERKSINKKLVTFCRQSPALYNLKDKECADGMDIIKYTGKDRDVFIYHPERSSPAKIVLNPKNWSDNRESIKIDLSRNGLMREWELFLVSHELWQWLWYQRVYMVPNAIWPQVPKDKWVEEMQEFFSGIMHYLDGVMHRYADDPVMEELCFDSRVFYCQGPDGLMSLGDKPNQVHTHNFLGKLFPCVGGYVCDGKIFAPGEPKVTGRGQYNTWVSVDYYAPIQTPAASEKYLDDVFIFDLILQNVCGCNQEWYNWLVCFCYCLIEFPGQKMIATPWFIGNPGIGKTLLGEILGKILGGPRQADCSSSYELLFGSADSTRFNLAVFHEKSLIMLNEGTLSKKQYEQFKAKTGAADIRYEHKGQDACSGKINARFIFASNHGDVADVLDRDDRRVFVIQHEMPMGSKVAAPLKDLGLSVEAMTSLRGKTIEPEDREEQRNLLGAIRHFISRKARKIAESHNIPYSFTALNSFLSDGIAAQRAAGVTVSAPEDMNETRLRAAMKGIVFIAQSDHLDAPIKKRICFQSTELIGRLVDREEITMRFLNSKKRLLARILTDMGYANRKCRLSGYRDQYFWVLAGHGLTVEAIGAEHITACKAKTMVEDC